MEGTMGPWIQASSGFYEIKYNEQRRATHLAPAN